MATIYLSVKHFTEDGAEHIDIEQTLTGGIKGTNEHRILDWTERSHEDHVFGPVLSKSRRVSLDEVDQEWLKKDWLDDSFADGKIIYTCAKSDTEKSGKTWSSEQVREEHATECCRTIYVSTPRSRFGVSRWSTARRGTQDMCTLKVRRERS